MPDPIIGDVEIPIDVVNAGVLVAEAQAQRRGSGIRLVHAEAQQSNAPVDYAALDLGDELRADPGSGPTRGLL